MKAKKNLVLLIPSLKRGGAERVVSRLSSLLTDEFNMHIVLFDGSSVDYKCSCEVTVLNEESDSKHIVSKFFKSLKRIMKYKKFKKQNNIDITYSFGNTANIVNIFSGYKDFKVSSIRGFGNLKLADNTLKGSIFRNITKLTLKKSDLIISVSEKIKYVIEKKFKIEPQKIKVIYNGYDVEEIELMSKQNLSLEEEKWMKDKFIYIAMGTYRVEKNYENLLRSFVKINKYDSHTGLIIIGKGNKEEEMKLKDLIKDLGIENQVYLTGFTDNPYKYLAKSDCFVLSSRTEGFPNALVEAMVCGLPIISTDCNTGPREILSNNNILQVSKNIEQSDYGILVKPFSEIELTAEDISHLIEAMENIKNDERLRYRYSQLSRKRVEDFSYQKWKKDHLNLLKKPSIGQ